MSEGTPRITTDFNIGDLIALVATTSLLEPAAQGAIQPVQALASAANALNFNVNTSSIGNLISIYDRLGAAIAKTGKVAGETGKFLEEFNKTVKTLQDVQTKGGGLIGPQTIEQMKGVTNEFAQWVQHINNVQKGIAGISAPTGASRKTPATMTAPSASGGQIPTLAGVTKVELQKGPKGPMVRVLKPGKGGANRWHNATESELRDIVTAAPAWGEILGINFQDVKDENLTTIKALSKYIGVNEENLQKHLKEIGIQYSDMDEATRRVFAKQMSETYNKITTKQQIIKSGKIRESAFIERAKGMGVDENQAKKFLRIMGEQEKPIAIDGGTPSKFIHPSRLDDLVAYNKTGYIPEKLNPKTIEGLAAVYGAPEASIKRILQGGGWQESNLQGMTAPEYAKLRKRITDEIEGPSKDVFQKKLITQSELLRRAKDMGVTKTEAMRFVSPEYANITPLDAPVPGTKTQAKFYDPEILSPMKQWKETGRLPESFVPRSIEGIASATGIPTEQIQRRLTETGRKVEDFSKYTEAEVSRAISDIKTGVIYTGSDARSTVTKTTFLKELRGDLSGGLRTGMPIQEINKILPLFEQHFEQKTVPGSGRMGTYVPRELAGVIQNFAKEGLLDRKFLLSVNQFADKLNINQRDLDRILQKWPTMGPSLGIAPPRAGQQMTSQQMYAMWQISQLPPPSISPEIWGEPSMTPRQRRPQPIGDFSGQFASAPGGRVPPPGMIGGGNIPRPAGGNMVEDANLVSPITRARYEQMGGQTKMARTLEIAAYRTMAYGAYGMGIYATRKAIKDVTDVISEAEQRFVSLRKVMDPLKTDFDQLRKSMFDMAKETGRGFKETGDIMFEFAKQGRSSTEIEQLTKQVLLMGNIGEMGAEKAVKSITSTLAQFNLTAADAASIVDRLNNVSNKNAVSFQALAEAIGQTGSAFATQGGNLDDLLPIISGLSSATQLTGATMGRVLRQTFVRMSRPHFKGIVEGVGIKTRNERGQSVAPFEVLEQLGEKWASLAPTKQFEIATEAGGGRYTSYFQALMSNWDKVMKARGDVFDAELSAYKENAFYMETYQAKVNQAQAAWAELAQTVGDAGFLSLLKNIAEISKGIAESESGEFLARQFGKESTILGGVGIITGLAMTNLVKTWGGLADYVLTSHPTAEMAGVVSKQGLTLQIQNALGAFLWKHTPYTHRTGDLAGEYATGMDYIKAVHGTGVDPEGHGYRPTEVKSIKQLLGSVVGVLKLIPGWGWALLAAITALTAVLTIMHLKQKRQNEAMEAATKAMLEFRFAGLDLVAAMENLSGQTTMMGILDARVNMRKTLDSFVENLNTIAAGAGDQIKEDVLNKLNMDISRGGIEVDYGDGKIDILGDEFLDLPSEDKKQIIDNVRKQILIANAEVHGKANEIFNNTVGEKRREEAARIRGYYMAMYPQIPHDFRERLLRMDEGTLRYSPQAFINEAAFDVNEAQKQFDKFLDWAEKTPSYAVYAEEAKTIKAEYDRLTSVITNLDTKAEIDEFYNKVLGVTEGLMKEELDKLIAAGSVAIRGGVELDEVVNLLSGGDDDLEAKLRSALKTEERRRASIEVYLISVEKINDLLKEITEEYEKQIGILARQKSMLEANTGLFGLQSTKLFKDLSLAGLNKEIRLLYDNIIKQRESLNEVEKAEKSLVGDGTGTSPDEGSAIYAQMELYSQIQQELRTVERNLQQDEGNTSLQNEKTRLEGELATAESELTQLQESYKEYNKLRIDIESKYLNAMSDLYRKKQEELALVTDILHSQLGIVGATQNLQEVIEGVSSDFHRFALDVIQTQLQIRKGTVQQGIFAGTYSSVSSYAGRSDQIYMEQVNNRLAFTEKQFDHYSEMTAKTQLAINEMVATRRVAQPWLENEMESLFSQFENIFNFRGAITPTPGDNSLFGMLFGNLRRFQPDSTNFVDLFLGNVSGDNRNNKIYDILEMIRVHAAIGDDIEGAAQGMLRRNFMVPEWLDGTFADLTPEEMQERIKSQEERLRWMHNYGKYAGVDFDFPIKDGETAIGAQSPYERAIKITKQKNALEIALLDGGADLTDEERKAMQLKIATTFFEETTSAFDEMVGKLEDAGIFNKINDLLVDIANSPALMFIGQWQLAMQQLDGALEYYSKEQTRWQMEYVRRSLEVLFTEIVVQARDATRQIEKERELFQVGRIVGRYQSAAIDSHQRRMGISLGTTGFSSLSENWLSDTEDSISTFLERHRNIILSTYETHKTFMETMRRAEQMGLTLDIGQEVARYWEDYGRRAIMAQEAVQQVQRLMTRKIALQSVSEMERGLSEIIQSFHSIENMSNAINVQRIVQSGYGNIESASGMAAGSIADSIGDSQNKLINEYLTTTQRIAELQKRIRFAKENDVEDSYLLVEALSYQEKELKKIAQALQAISAISVFAKMQQQLGETIKIFNDFVDSTRTSKLVDEQMGPIMSFVQRRAGMTEFSDDFVSEDTRQLDRITTAITSSTDMIIALLTSGIKLEDATAQLIAQGVVSEDFAPQSIDDAVGQIQNNLAFLMQERQRLQLSRGVADREKSIGMGYFDLMLEGGLGGIGGVSKTSQLYETARMEIGKDIISKGTPAMRDALIQMLQGVDVATATVGLGEDEAKILQKYADWAQKGQLSADIERFTEASINLPADIAGRMLSQMEIMQMSGMALNIEGASPEERLIDALNNLDDTVHDWIEIIKGDVLDTLAEPELTSIEDEPELPVMGNWLTEIMAAAFNEAPWLFANPTGLPGELPGATPFGTPAEPEYKEALDKLSMTINKQFPELTVAINRLSAVMLGTSSGASVHNPRQRRSMNSNVVGQQPSGNIPTNTGVTFDPAPIRQVCPSVPWNNRQQSVPPTGVRVPTNPFR